MIFVLTFFFGSGPACDGLTMVRSIADYNLIDRRKFQQFLEFQIFTPAKSKTISSKVSLSLLCASSNIFVTTSPWNCLIKYFRSIWYPSLAPRGQNRWKCCRFPLLSAFLPYSRGERARQERWKSFSLGCDGRIHVSSIIFPARNSSNYVSN